MILYSGEVSPFSRMCEIVARKEIMGQDRRPSTQKVHHHNPFLESVKLKILK